MRSLEHSPIPHDWNWDNKHWHAYSYSPGVSSVRSEDRMRRLQLTPEAVLHNPAEVADWVEQEYSVHAPATQPDNVTQSPQIVIEMQERSDYRWRTNAVLAGRGESIYIEVKNIGYVGVRNTPASRELYIESVTPDLCSCASTPQS